MCPWDFQVQDRRAVLIINTRTTSVTRQGHQLRRSTENNIWTHTHALLRICTHSLMLAALPDVARRQLQTQRRQKATLEKTYRQQTTYLTYYWTCNDPSRQTQCPRSCSTPFWTTAGISAAFSDIQMVVQTFKRRECPLQVLKWKGPAILCYLCRESLVHPHYAAIIPDLDLALQRRVSHDGATISPFSLKKKANKLPLRWHGSEVPLRAPFTVWLHHRSELAVGLHQHRLL